ncbi:MAG TPA: hypothetical protein VH914_07650 [Acidimicrobiia bacterium]|nr:hypothetical protein [Acidimicrobiia bacterium]
MHVLAIVLPLLLIAAVLILGVRLRRSGFYESSARERRARPMGGHGWIFMTLMLATAALVLVMSIQRRGFASAVTTFVVSGVGSVLVARWMRGGRASS